MIYVLPEHRKKLGLRLIYETARRGKEVNSKMMVWCSKAGTPFERVMGRLCTPIETLWRMDL